MSVYSEKCVVCYKELTINEIFYHDNMEYCREHYLLHRNERKMIEDMARRGRPPLVARQQQEQKPAIKIAQANEEDLMRYTVNKGDVIIPNPLDVEQFDKVEHPSHYQIGNLEVIDIIRESMSKEKFIGYLEGNIKKYIFRWEHKNGIEDLKKARKYTEFLIKELEKPL